MSDAQTTGSLLLLAFAVYIAFLAGRASLRKQIEHSPPPKLDRLVEGDIRETLRALRPLTRHNMPTDVSIFVFGDGEIHLHAKLLGGSEVKASGDTLESVKLSISRQAKEIAEAFS